jgi:hypothetical protein
MSRRTEGVWVNALPGQQYHDTLRQGVEALLLTMEIAMASALNGLQNVGIVAPRGLLHFDDQDSLLSFLCREDFEAESADRRLFMTSASE